MAILNQKQRNASETLPGGRYPMPDAGHARAALGRINQGGLSSGQKATVRARAHKILGAAQRSSANANV
jgi:hypothetical protein